MPSMPWGLGDTKDLGYFMSLAQVGLEFVAPLVLGAVLDRFLNWSPWGIVVGGLLGFVGGTYHLVLLAGKRRPNSSSKAQEERRP
jgi:F0F1-type ATP synthase assembly protein I